MDKHSVAIVLPYYGKFPNYFPLWLKSVGANPSFTFMIFTDIDMSGYNIPANVKVYHMTFEELKKLIAPHLDFDFVLDNPYKLCDYKTMYGLIFEDYLEGYDFWGFCDCDLIFGNMGKYINDDMLDRYEKLYHNGHLQLFRNLRDVNRFALNSLPYWNISYRDVYRVPRCVNFDEFALPAHLFDEFVTKRVCGEGGGQYYAPDFADIIPFAREFKIWYNERVFPAFRWKDGKLFALYVNGNPDLNIEYLYLHLQKRPMNFTPGLEDDTSFLVIPNEFVKDRELTQEEIAQLMTPDPQYEQEFYAKYGEIFRARPTIIRRIKNLIKTLVGNDPEKIYKLKLLVNRLLMRSLPSNW